MNALPIFVRLSGRRVILVGEGEAADAKRRLLERAGGVAVDEAGVPLPAGSDGDRLSTGRRKPPRSLRAQSGSGHERDVQGFSTTLETNGEEGRREANGRETRSEADALGPIIAIVVDDEAAVARLKARGLLVNAVDRPDLCDFTLPAIVDRSPVLVAIGTGGVSAGLAAALRQRLETLLPATLGRLAEVLHAARADLRARLPDGDARRRAIGAALAPGGPLDPLADHAQPDAALIGTAPPPRTERIRLRSADPDDLTLREARWLALADRVTHGADVPAAILDRARADAVRVPGPAMSGAPGLTVELAWAGA